MILTGAITDPASITDAFTTLITGAQDLIPLMLKAPMVYFVALALLGGCGGLIGAFVHKRR
jgi:hypothetical protein